MTFLDKISLIDKKVYVVGGYGTIGSKLIENLTLTGADILILDIKKKKANEIIKYEKFDCSKLNTLEKSFKKILKGNGCPDIFINCSYPRTNDWGKCSFEEITLKRMSKNIEIHMNSYAWLSRMIAEEMVKKEVKGNIINMNSIYGLLGQDISVYKNTKMKENMAYSIIKGGLISLTKQMASYYGKYEIRVNSICSGGLKGHVAGKSNFQEKQFIKNYEKKVPLRRLGNPKEIADIITFVASDASSYITGTNILVDGGWSII